MAEASRARARRYAAAAIVVAIVLFIAVCVVALIPIWPCVLFEHFRVQYFVGGRLLVAGAAALRMRGYFDAAVLATLFQLVWLAPDLGRTATPLPSGTPLRVLVLNVRMGSSGFSDVRRLVDDERPDVVALVEVNQRWLDVLAPSLASYPGRLAEPRDDNFGIALYARTALTGAIEKLGGPWPTVIGELAVGGTPLGVVVVHTLPPVSGEALDAQREQLDAIAARVRSMRGHIIVVGDFNATPWSRPFRRFVGQTGLCDTRAGFGVQATWPTTTKLLGIPLDHALVTCAIGVADRRVARHVGSDHLPVVVDLVVP